MKVSVIGATGYAGAELLRILYQHPQAEVVHVTSESHTGERISALYPHLRGLYDLELESMKDISRIGEDSDFVFIGLPHGHAMEVGKALEKFPVRIIDLGADYRFSNTAVYEEWYHVPHTHPEAERVYGLAELYREEIRRAKIIGNAGCFTTASILALAPLAKHRLIDMNTIIVDAKSGVSGAGRSPKQGNHFPELYDSFKAYNVAHHRHTPEIEQALEELSGETVVLNFTPHLVPMSRGILATCYGTLKQEITAEMVDAAFQKMYGNEYFIRLLGRNGYPATKDVRGSNFCDIAWHIDERTRRVIVLSAIDNLVKGAAGQAVQNFNIACGFEEKMGLDVVPMYP
ncbi:MAG: N-acetyl-gamma-glutamyl-phosphate reductase [Selenomonadaceae bacterium]|nr:N-acetyl-gamma-glutamyl-phosphate reductase [Selenomonadaceae bacterium]MBR0283681.1 N-acetyl-gamma-glutamyl-phosphate reductase [Selenomonadaceae bacterium]MBR6343009.1 N-acetyl-gamma-glutamyl-phosphate reductase [Selenomonadaceae bacterium]MBR6905728.1 N-acetyl-gamma-glutamyl-phosphate reductase [Selenomonadaceae bacterium]